MMLRIFCVTVLCFFCQPFFIKAQSFVQQSVDDFISDSIFAHTTVGIDVLDLSTGRSLAQHRRDKSLATASLLKILTTGTILEQYGADFRYTTPVSYTGKIVLGKIEGNLVIKGSGDPTFNSYYFPDNDVVARIVNLLRENGIRSISKDILIDVSLFESTVPDKWIWEDISNYYGASVNPLNYYDNLYKLSFRTGAAGSLATVLGTYPRQHLQFESDVRASKINADKAFIFGGAKSPNRLITGTIPQYRKRFTIKGAMPNPPLTFGEAVVAALGKAGIALQGKIRVLESPLNESVESLGSVFSPKLESIITQTNQQSINLFAEALLLLTKGANHDRELALTLLKRYWKNNGLDISGVYLHDGSGLSHFNAVNPAFFTAFLRKMHYSTNSKVFKNSLGVSGEKGTLVYLGKNSPIKGKVFGKSGSMSQVCCYAGYTTLSDGREVAFAIMVNNFPISMYRLRKRIARMLEEWTE